MTALLRKDKPDGGVEGGWIVRGEDRNRELVQMLLPGKGDEGQDSTPADSLFQPSLKSPLVNMPCPLLPFASPASFPASTS